MTLFKCSTVYQRFYIPINNKAASMTAAPFNMVAIRMSCPGQSTNDTCLKDNENKTNKTCSLMLLFYGMLNE